MSLSIKDPEAHRLAEAIAAETGQNMTRVVIEALRERHAKLTQRRRRPTAQDIMAVAAKVRATLHGPLPDHDELLYDEHGLPK